MFRATIRPDACRCAIVDSDDTQSFARVAGISAEGWYPRNLDILIVFDAVDRR